MEKPRESTPNAVLICGLGRLGEHCALVLKELGVSVYGLNERGHPSWENERSPSLFDRLTVGDCRRHSALREAGIASCRAVLLTTSDERVNVTAAIAARSLNPEIRLILRSSQKNLNEVLDQTLGNMVALDLAELPAAAFSMAAIGSETVGLFPLEDRMLRVVEKCIASNHLWHASRTLDELNTRWRRVLDRTGAREQSVIDFYSWDPRDRLNAGDVLTYIELTDSIEPRTAETSDRPSRMLRGIRWANLRTMPVWLWRRASSSWRSVIVVGCALLLIHLTGLIVYKTRYPEISLLDAFNIATVLIFDGYSNMFAQLKLPFPIPAWLLLYSLLMTISGAVVTGMVYAFLTARVLSARLQFRRRTGRIPSRNHVVVLGLGRLGHRVASLLHELRQPVAGADEDEPDSDALPDVAVVTGSLRQAIQKTNCSTAASVLVLTDDDVKNLELALLTARSNQNCNLVIRSDDTEFGSSLSSLAPRVHTISTYALSAEAFAAAALGEKVLNLIRIRRQTVLVTEYEVTDGDTLEQRLLSEVACGYGVVPVLHQQRSEAAAFFPSDDIRLAAGDRLVVLATIDGLHRVEHGSASERSYRVRITRALSQELSFEAARVIARISGCELGAARTLMAELPGTLETPLYRHQADRMVRELGRVSVSAEAMPAGSAPLRA
jgi:Trk K+ transport system NAD-binding subunit